MDASASEREGSDCAYLPRLPTEMGLPTQTRKGRKQDVRYVHGLMIGLAYIHVSWQLGITDPGPPLSMHPVLNSSARVQEP